MFKFRGKFGVLFDFNIKIMDFCGFFMGGSYVKMSSVLEHTFSLYLNSILYTNELLWKIGYTSNPNCSFCHQTTETMSHILFDCSFSTSFWNEICDKILNKLNSCRSLSLEYREIILGYLTGEMDLLNYILILGKTYLWTCRYKETKPSFSHFGRILLNKYQTEKYISFKSNNSNLFKKKWRNFEETILLID